MSIGDEHVETLLWLVRRGDRDGARRLVHSLASDYGPDAVIEEVLAGAQARTGDLWATSEWSVADEHLATSIIDGVLGTIDLIGPPPSEPGPQVVVACAEGEWHALPAKMVAARLRLRGCGVWFLGASTPPEHLRRFIVERRPVALALSTTMPTALGGARRCVAAAHQAGVPVVAGGRGLGTDARRAEAIGADTWANHPDTALDALRGWSDQPPEIVGAHPAVLTLTLEAERADIVTRAARNLVLAWAGFDRLDGVQRRRAEEHLNYAIDHVIAALDVHDPALFDDFVVWLDGVAESRGMPPSFVPLALDILAESVPAGEEAARDLLRSAAARAGAAER